MSENPVRDLLDQIPRTEKIDQVARPLRQAAEKIAETPGLSEALAAQPTGHPLHPALVHLPIGGALTAASLEILGLGRLRLATALATGVVVAGAAPAALTGLADWAARRDTDEDRRVGAAHAVCAGSGTTLALLSLLARTGGSHGLARLLLFGSAAAYTAAGDLGGELSQGPQPEAVFLSDRTDAPGEDEDHHYA